VILASGPDESDLDGHIPEALDRPNGSLSNMPGIAAGAS
jgi:hypothetical protein